MFPSSQVAIAIADSVAAEADGCFQRDQRTSDPSTSECVRGKNAAAPERMAVGGTGYALRPPADP